MKHLATICNRTSRTWLSAVTKRGRGLLEKEDGFGTLEVVIIIGVMLAIAMIFRNQIMAFATKLINHVFNNSIIDGL